MHKLQVLLVVVCVAVGPSLAQITFSRSWVPQGKRSGAPMSSGTPSDLGESCYDACIDVLTQFDAKISDLIRAVHETSSADSRLRKFNSLK
ncbi:uncharacterized protein LOC134769714 [Penaeus indicus]|uniref:uncharacterized protein LOC134769714 n=1 Tax=Penaeus indicus TaxID=29960 RepID=UPI00300C0ED1